MNLDYLLPPLIAAGISLSLLIMLLLHRRKERSHWLLSLLLMDITIWALVIFAMRSSPDVERALFWDRAVIFFVFAAPLLCYHFSVALTKVGRQRNLLPIGYIVLVVVLALSPTDLLVQRMEIQPYGYAPIIGPAMLPIVAFAYLLMTMTMYNFFKAYRASSEYREKNRLLYVTIAMFFPLIGTIFEIFPTIYPTSIFGSIALCLLITVAILKYHLLDIRVVVRKSLAYLLVSLVIAVPYVSILLLLNQILRTRMEPWWVHTIIVLLLAILLRPLYSRAQHLVDRLFYRDRYDYLKALEQFSQKAQSVVNLKELSSTLTRLVSGALHTSSACLLLPSESDNGLIVVSSTGLGSPPSGVVLRNRSPLVKWLKLQQRILSSEEFNIVPQLQSLSLREKNNLEQMEAKLCVLIQTGPGQLSGILVLGQKLSQQPYSSEDRQLLTALSSQMAIALENARLYTESQREVAERKRVEERGKQLQQEVYLSSRLAAVGELAAGVAHEINNPLTGVLGYSQRLLRKSTNEEISRDLQIIYNEAQRAAKVVQNLLAFARRREPKKEHLNINDILQKALELRAYELQTGNIEVVTDLAPSLPDTIVDFHQIQETFLNIILNAEQVMTEANGEGRLTIKTREIKDYARISFTDNGPGIPAKHLVKIFDPFFTTRGERGGTGLGLSACHGIVTEHGGRIYAKSKPGKGATFFVELPILTEMIAKG